MKIPTREELEEMVKQMQDDIDNCTCADHFKGTRQQWLDLKLLEMMKSSSESMLGASALAAAGGRGEMAIAFAKSAFQVAVAAGTQVAKVEEEIMAQLDDIMSAKVAEYALQVKERLDEQWNADGTPKERENGGDHEHQPE